MSTPAPAPEPAKTKTRRKDCYIARLTVRIPLDVADAGSLGAAVDAVQGIKKAMPAGTEIEITGSLGKM